MNNNLNDGGPAFPWHNPNPGVCTGEVGMSLRDYFAAAALTGALSSHHADVDGPYEDFAIASYKQADAMIKARGDDFDPPSEDYLLEALEIAEYELSRANGYLLQRIKEKENVIGWQNDTQRTLKLVRNAIKKYKNQTF